MPLFQPLISFSRKLTLCKIRTGWNNTVIVTFRAKSWAKMKENLVLALVKRRNR